MVPVNALEFLYTVRTDCLNHCLLLNLRGSQELTKHSSKYAKPSTTSVVIHIIIVALQQSRAMTPTKSALYLNFNQNEGGGFNYTELLFKPYLNAVIHKY